ncbi:MAG: hypothetical protein JXJ17_05695 [Anaerolineae bacterium]|nr:hypothetical protein [Anaerolineae bacterium]
MNIEFSPKLIIDEIERILKSQGLDPIDNLSIQFTVPKEQFEMLAQVPEIAVQDFMLQRHGEEDGFVWQIVINRPLTTKDIDPRQFSDL